MSNVKLNQIIAVEKGAKTSTNKRVTDRYHQFQKSELFQGISRSYSPKDEDGERLPGESKNVQVQATDILRDIAGDLTSLFDIVATKEWGNTVATADVVVDDTTILSAVPVTYLLFLEKQLVDIHTIITKIPTLDPADNWTFDETVNAFVSDEVETHRTKKVPRNHVKAEATDKHPAQVEVYTEDVVVGYWKTKKFSGALPAARIRQLLDRVESLQRAVKFAREQANEADVTQQKVGEYIFDYILS